MSFSPDGSTLASGTSYIFSGELAGVLLWDVNTGQLKAPPLYGS